MANPIVLYKYRDWSKTTHQSLLKDYRGYFASPRDFNDPFDCRIYPNMYLLNTHELKMTYAEAVVERLMKRVIAEGRDPYKEVERVFNRINSDIAKFQHESDLIHREYQDKYYGVFSMSACWDNILMWSHYSNNHKGFCVGFYEEKFREPPIFGKGGLVSYSKQVPDIIPDLNPDSQLTEERVRTSFTETHVKAEDWSYEQEYRLTKLFYPGEPTIEERTLTFPKDSIAEVILGCRISEELEEEIVDICKGRKIPVSKCMIPPFKFVLDKYNV